MTANAKTEAALLRDQIAATTPEQLGLLPAQ